MTKHDIQRQVSPYIVYAAYELKTSKLLHFSIPEKVMDIEREREGGEIKKREERKRNDSQNITGGSMAKLIKSLEKGDRLNREQ